MATPPDPLLTVRATVVLLVAVLIGIVAGYLGYLANSGSLATAVLVGGGATGAALALFHNLLGR